MPHSDDDILPEYSLDGGVRGKHADAYAHGATAAHEEGVEAEAHRRYLELENGQSEGVDGDEVIAQLRARRRR